MESEMHLNPILLSGSILTIALSSSALAQNKFLAPNAEEITIPVSCSVPADLVAIASNLGPRDIYLARTGPSLDSDYVDTFLEVDTRVSLNQNFMMTTDSDVAELCAQIEEGDNGDVAHDQLKAAIAANLLWWPIDADKDLLSYPDSERWGEQQSHTAYVSAKHISFVSSDEWDVLTAPNALGYIDNGSRWNPTPIALIEGIDTANARAVAGDGRQSMGQCLAGFNISDLLRVFWDQPDSDAPKTMPVSQTDFRIEDGIWSDCRFDDEILEGDPEWNPEWEEHVNQVEADCIAGTSNGYEIDGSMLPVSYGAAGGLGTNFALLCPEKTIELIQADCDQRGDDSCDRLTEFLEQ